MNSSRKNRLEIETETRGAATLVRLQGEVDVSVSPQLRARLKELTNQKSSPIVVDMAGVPYIDSSGVATLVECLQSVSRYGGALRLAAMAERTMSVFEISRLDTVFKIFKTVDEALKA